ncbi:hypothetical protein OHA01_21365 [Micromonospora zamorensis]|uniref:hypothetical protein n=1 Tax=Micromonospora zamorensis TaxID=709883 RepID=UPI0012FD15CC|nr:hypothetical protein [Micromonospora zamorensis]WSK46190.1 hypothetical protein OG423_19285 [Micromonospora zamorensis]WTE85140.1 hypothetical protein OHA01_21365 [Micromonospora zamorensis]
MTTALPQFLVDKLAAHVAGKRRDALAFTAPNGGPLRNTNSERGSSRQQQRQSGRPGGATPGCVR